MITIHENTPGCPIKGSHFRVNGERTSKDVRQLFREGMKASPEASEILTKWEREDDMIAQANERAWAKFNEANPNW